MLKISGFYDNSCTNGEGWRSVLFFSGCPHRCEGCQNPDTWDYNYGADISVKELIKRVKNNLPIIDGVTLSGGEPFQKRNIGKIIEFLNGIDGLGLDIWCYTGYNYEDLLNDDEFKKLLKRVDVLIDGKFDKSKFDTELRFRGSSNQRIIDVKNSLIKKRVSLLYNNSLVNV